MSSEVSGLMFSDLVSLVIGGCCQDDGGLKDNIWLETKEYVHSLWPVFPSKKSQGKIDVWD